MSLGIKMVAGKLICILNSAWSEPMWILSYLLKVTVLRYESLAYDSIIVYSYFVLLEVLALQQEINVFISEIRKKKKKTKQLTTILESILNVRVLKYWHSHPEKLWMSHPWSHSRPVWMGLWAAWAGKEQPYPQQGVGAGWSRKSLPFYDYMIIMKIAELCVPGVLFSSSRDFHVPENCILYFQKDSLQGRELISITMYRVVQLL